MSDERNNIESDLMMRSILEGAQEEVPANVWEGVSAGLDKAARRKTVVLWWRRSAIGTAVAAAVAALFLINREPDNVNIVPEAGESGMIAVADPVIQTDTAVAVDLDEEYVALAAPVKIAAAESEEDDTMTVITETPEETIVEADINVRQSRQNASASDDWNSFEDEPVKKKFKTSLVISGLTGTNSIQNSAKKNLYKRPSLSQSRVSTGINETSTNSTYGIPLSFGAGVKVGLSPKWSLGAGVNYSLLSRSFFGTYTKAGSNGTISSDIRNTQHFIGIPVNAYYTILDNKSINFYAYAGGTVEKCITDRYDVLSTSIIHKESPKGVQLSANAGIGVEFMMGRHLGLYIDPSLRYYFNCGQPKSIRTVQPLMLGFEMGLRFKL